MNFIKKFYDAAISEPAEKVEEQAPTEKPSIASLMATQGVRNNTSEMVATPIEIKEVEEKPKEEKEAAPVATTTEPIKTEEGKSETPKAEVEQTKVPEPQKVEEPAKVQTWQEVLKNQQPETVLKELLGVDDKVVNFFKELKDADPKLVGILQAHKEGKLNEYVKELNTDYSKMEAEEVMRHQLRLDYPKATEKQLEVLFKKDVIEQYNLDSLDEDEAEEGKLLLEAKADKFRDNLIKNQEQYFVDKYVAPQPKDTVDTDKAAMVENITKYFNEDTYTKSVVADNALTLGEGEDKFVFPINGKEVSDLVINGDVDGSLMFDISKDSNGQDVYKPKSQHQILVATVQKYGMNFLNEYAKHYKSLGGKAAIEPIDNAKPKGESSQSSSDKPAPKTAAEAMARMGTHNSGGM